MNRCSSERLQSVNSVGNEQEETKCLGEVAPGHEAGGKEGDLVYADAENLSPQQRRECEDLRKENEVGR